MEFERYGFHEVLDAEEDTSILYAVSPLLNTLGYVSLAQSVTVSIQGVSYTVQQRPEYLKHGKGVTGAVLWRTTPVLLEYLVRCPWFSLEGKSPSQMILELGSGIGLGACVLGKTFPECVVVASDHDTALLKLVRKNLDRNFGDDVRVVELDWADPASSYLPALTSCSPGKGASLEWIVCLDCVYSPHLATLLVKCLNTLIDQYPSVKIIIGQQIREETVHADFIHALSLTLNVWRLKTAMEQDEDEDETQKADAKLIEGYSIYLATSKTQPL